MSEQDHREEECEVCGHVGCERKQYDGHGYTVTFRTCARCAETLARAFDGVSLALSQGHEEKRERFIDKLMRRLDAAGFETAPLRIRRDA